MTSDLDSSPDSRAPSRGDRRRMRAYLIEFSAALAAYIVVLMLVVAFGGLDGHSPWRYVWAVLPALPGIAIVLAVWRHLQRLDELQRVIALTQLAISFGVAMVAAVTLGLLAGAGLVLSGAPWIIYGAGMASWAVISLVLRKPASC